MVRKITSFLLVICFLSTSVLGYVTSQVVYGNEQPSEIFNDAELSEEETILDDNPTTEDEKIEDKGEEATEPTKEEDNIKVPPTIEEDTKIVNSESEQKLPKEEGGNKPAISAGIITPEMLEDSLELENSATFADSFLKSYSNKNLNLANNPPIVNMADSKNFNSKSSKNGDTNAEEKSKASDCVPVK